MSKLRRLGAVARSGGIAGLMHFARIHFCQLLARPPDFFAEWRAQFKGKMGLEIGGPSQVFSSRGVLPVYSLLSRLDHCNFAASNAWGETQITGAEVVLENGECRGRQFHAEATDLRLFASESYDCILASHVLEHIANPILALEEWMRVLKPDGVLAVVVPNRQDTFDRFRSVTSVEHLLRDFEQGVGEDDLTHLGEILQLHDLTRDPDAADYAKFVARSQNNFKNRCLHHHVYDEETINELAKIVGLGRVSAALLKPYHLVMLAEK